MMVFYIEKRNKETTYSVQSKSPKKSAIQITTQEAWDNTLFIENNAFIH